MINVYDISFNKWDLFSDLHLLNYKQIQSVSDFLLYTELSQILSIGIQTFSQLKINLRINK